MSREVPPTPATVTEAEFHALHPVTLPMPVPPLPGEESCGSAVIFPGTDGSLAAW
ncbi:hypothetical protein ACFYZ8_06805 [Streptomyces sp. NPDC001668]|uniref:hypothetical protein n=1 Tax=unclassified Streptomyces TaxID=2593676 RepID=UPI0036D19FD1